MKQGEGSEGAGRGGKVDKVRQIWKREVMDSLECVKDFFKLICNFTWSQ